MNGTDPNTGNFCATVTESGETQGSGSDGSICDDEPLLCGGLDPWEGILISSNVNQTPNPSVIFRATGTATYPNNAVPQNACIYMGRALPPIAYSSAGKAARNNPVNSVLDLIKGFKIGGYLDAQPLAAGNIYERAAYGNYVFGTYMAAAGFPLSIALAGADGIAAVHKFSNRNQYSGRQMDSFWRSLPASNVANITAGYNAQRNGTLCHN